METTMLIIDDIEMNREILRVLFEDKYAVLEAESGEEAVEVLERCQDSIDVILLDLLMPGMSGFDVLKWIRNQDYCKDTPVVVITSSGAMQDQVKAFDMGANDFVNKPFVPEIVISRVDNVLASHRRMMSVELEAQKLKVKSELDQMTGLYNKTTAEVTINETLKKIPDRMHAMFVIDIDNFKSVNDTSGHLAGDHVIKIIADLISSLFRKSDIVGRIGGDEFIAMMVDVPSMNIVHSKVNELIQIMKYKPNLTIPENVTLSIGIASSDGRETTYDELFKKADSALYEAKQAGKACYREYGVEAVSVNDHTRPSVLLLSRNRSVCSIIQSMIPVEVRVIEAISVDRLAFVHPLDIDSIRAIYADVSDSEDDGSEFFAKLKSFDWVKMDKVMAICEEGNVQQYMTALGNGVSDMITAPLDSAAFKRRIIKQLGSEN